MHAYEEPENREGNSSEEESVDLTWVLLDIAKSLSSERDLWKLYERVLEEAQKITHADGGTLYLLNQIEGEPHLEFVITRNYSLNLSVTKRDSEENQIAPIPLYKKDTREPNRKNIAAYCALNKKMLNLSSAYETEDFDIQGVREFDRDYYYVTKSILTVPLLDHDEHVVGVLQLINSTGGHSHQIKPFLPDDVNVIEALASLIAVVIDNNNMMSHRDDLLVKFAAQTESRKLFDTIVTEAKTISRAEAGTLYLMQQDEHGQRLEYSIVINDALGLYLGGSSDREVRFNHLPMMLEDGTPNYANVATYTAITKKIVNIPDLYHSSDFDFSGIKAFDKSFNYRSCSFLSIPLLNHDHEVIGVLELINAKRHCSDKMAVPFQKNIEPVIAAIGSYAAISLENKLLFDDHKLLLDAFVKVIAKAIDEKSPHTSAHCQRVPVLMEMIAEATCQDQTYFPDFQLTEDGWYELKVAAWMHDCGKLATPDYVLEKSTKLDGFHDGVEAVTARFEVIKRSVENHYLRKMLNGGDQQLLQQELTQRLTQISDDQAFIQQVNRGCEHMSDEDKQRVIDVSSYYWETNDGERRPLLSDIDIENLCVTRGTLNDKERQMINGHIKLSIDMLEALPFPSNLANVPEYAGGHHERMDGTGFPRGLTRDEMSVPARMMAIADVFEAITAKDRPYKEPMKISQSLDILKSMRDRNQIDPDLYQVFLRERVWEKYGLEHLNPDQLDVDDTDDWL